MNRRILCICAAMLLAAMTMMANPYEKVLRRNLWNIGSNINGIRQDTLDVSQVFIISHFEKGEMRDVHDAPMEWNVGTLARTLVHLKNFSMMGSFEFDNRTSYDHCGSMFINSGLYPVDVIEFTPGLKTLQTYGFEGGLASDLGSHWRIGADLDFSAHNIAKRKDLRHSNYRLDLEFAPGFMYHSSSFSFGANYVFSRSMETVKAEQVGQKDNYSAFIDKGMMYGSSGIWTDASLHLSEAGINGFPVKENLHGAAMQLSWKEFFAQLKYMHGNGAIGEKQSIWFRFPTDEISLDLALRLANAHTIKLNAEASSMLNYASVLEKITEGGVTLTHEMGRNLIYVRDVMAIHPSYEYESDRLYAYLKGDLEHSLETLTYLYPYVERRAMTSWSIEAACSCKANGGRYGEFEFGLRSYAAGANVNDSESLSNATSGVLDKPVRCDWNEAHVAFLSAPRICLEPSVRYTFQKGIFTEASLSMLRAFGSGTLSGLMRTGAQLKIGYNF